MGEFADMSDMKTIFMPRWIHQKWDGALRSGEYEKGVGGLRDEDGGFCCLGILQDCLDGEVEKALGGDMSLGHPSMEWLAQKEIEFLCEDHLPGRNPYLPQKGMRAATMNDDTDATFPEIADAIAACVEYTDYEPDEEITQKWENGELGNDPEHARVVSPEVETAVQKALED